MLLEQFNKIPADPILQIGIEYVQCQNSAKIDLAIGLYQNNKGEVTILDSVKQAEHRLWQKENSKRYVPSYCDERFIELLPKTLFGIDNILANYAAAATPGGCGALSIIGQVLASTNAQSTIWMSRPTWGNHKALFLASGLQQAEYCYLNNNRLDFEQMLSDISKAKAGDVVLLQCSSHNPSGVDLTEEQIDRVLEIVLQNQLFAIIDCAYIGFGKSIAADSSLARKSLERLPECAIAISCSKIFSLYNDRCGMLLFKSKNHDAVQSHLDAILRRNYSMAPYHGPGVVGELLEDATLTNQWLQELQLMAKSIQDGREILVREFNNRNLGFEHIADNVGMFSMLGLSASQSLQLREQYFIFLLNSSRINVNGVRADNVQYIVDSIAKVI